MQKKPCLLLGSVGLLAMLLSLPLPAAPPARPSQIQVARQFLLALLRGDWAAAHRQLAPTTQATTSVEQVRQSAAGLVAAQRTYGPVIDLYKFGYRLRDGEKPEPFVAFTFRADTLSRSPHVQLDVTFRDSTTRQVQGFTVLQLPNKVPGPTAE